MPPSTDHPVNPPTAISGGGPGQTIIELKKAFLTTQIRLLTAPLQPPPTDWQERLPEPEEGDLRDGVIRDVLHKVNVILRHHSRSTYPSQTTRNIAEQIDAMYWTSGEPGNGEEEEDDLIFLRGLSKDVDLRVDENISLLPESWPEEPGPDQGDDNDDGEAQGNQELREQYHALQSRLTSLAAQRRATKQRLQQYKHLRRLLTPFEHGGQSIVLSMRAGGDEEGELMTEMKRMRLLIGRVEGCLERADWEDIRVDDGRGVEKDKLEETERGKIEGIIGLR